MQPAGRAGRANGEPGERGRAGRARDAAVRSQPGQCGTVLRLGYNPGGWAGARATELAGRATACAQARDPRGGSICAASGDAWLASVTRLQSRRRRGAALTPLGTDFLSCNGPPRPTQWQESAISVSSCTTHEQVEKLGKFKIVPKIRARLFGDSESPKSCQPQTRKASGAPLALSARRAFSQRCRSNSMSHQHCRSDYLATRFRKSWAANSNKTAGQKAFRPDFAGLSESSTSPKQRRRRVTDFVRGCPHIATAPQ